MSTTHEPGDWHETLVDLLAMDGGIPEDRARRFLARHAEEVRAAAPVTCHARECPCPPGCGCCPATADTALDLETQLAEAEALAGRWEEKYFAMGEKRSEALASIDRVQKVPTAPTGGVPGDLADWDSFMRGYKQGVLATKSALRSPNEPAVSGDHPCKHCDHPMAAHIVDPVWCRNCPPETSHTSNPGWHEYEPTEEQR